MATRITNELRTLTLCEYIKKSTAGHLYLLLSNPSSAVDGVITDGQWDNESNDPDAPDILDPADDVNGTPRLYDQRLGEPFGGLRIGKAILARARVSDGLTPDGGAVINGNPYDTFDADPTDPLFHERVRELSQRDNPVNAIILEASIDAHSSANGQVIPLGAYRQKILTEFTGTYANETTEGMVPKQTLIDMQTAGDFIGTFTLIENRKAIQRQQNQSEILRIIITL